MLSLWCLNSLTASYCSQALLSLLLSFCPQLTDVEGWKVFPAPSVIINQESLIFNVQKLVMKKHRFPHSTPFPISTAPFLLSFIFPAHLACIRLPAIALCGVIRPSRGNRDRFLSGHPSVCITDLFLTLSKRRSSGVRECGAQILLKSSSQQALGQYK